MQLISFILNPMCPVQTGSRHDFSYANSFGVKYVDGESSVAERRCCTKKYLGFFSIAILLVFLGFFLLVLFLSTCCIFAAMHSYIPTYFPLIWLHPSYRDAHNVTVASKLVNNFYSVQSFLKRQDAIRSVQIVKIMRMIYSEYFNDFFLSLRCYQNAIAFELNNVLLCTHIIHLLSILPMLMDINAKINECVFHTQNNESINHWHLRPRTFLKFPVASIVNAAIGQMPAHEIVPNNKKCLILSKTLFLQQSFH